MKQRIFFEKAAMTLTFCVFLYSLIAPMYIFLGGNGLSGIVYGRIPGMDLRLGLIDRLTITTFFVLLFLFFLTHAFYEKSVVKKLFAAFSCVYSAVYIIIILIVGTNGLVVLNFPIISIPLYVVVAAKFFVLLPSVYFMLVAWDKTKSRYVRCSAMFHATTLVLVGFIKVFEMIFPQNLRMTVFDCSTALYLVSLAMVTFFMYRKYYL